MKQQDDDLTLAYMTGYQKAVGEYRARTCENCLHSKIEGEYLMCKNMKALGWWSDIGVANSDECNKWSKKDD